jgi:hypothetical protein
MFLFLNVAASLVGGVKFVASLLYLEGKVFGYKRVALVVFRRLLDCTCVIFGNYCIFVF